MERRDLAEPICTHSIVGTLSQTGEQCVHVIPHEAVRNDVDAVIERSLQELRPAPFRACGVTEVLVSFERAHCQEDTRGTEIRFARQAWWSAMLHEVYRSKVLTARLKPSRYEAVAALKPSRFSRTRFVRGDVIHASDARILPSVAIQRSITGAAMVVQLFPTCLLNEFRPDAGMAVARVLEREGCEVVLPEGLTCCGQPAFNAGFHDEARQVARYTIGVLASTDGPIVVPSGCCSHLLLHL